MSSIVDLDAVHYKENSSRQYENARNLLKAVDIRPEYSILDVGCAHGEVIAELSLLAPQGKCVGVDPSPNMIAQAASTFPKEKYGNLEFRLAKAETMQFENNQFDVIICTSALHWVREPKKALKLMCDFLKPNGSLAILTYSKNTPYARLFEGVLNKHFPELKALAAVNSMLPVDEYRRVLAEDNNMLLEVFQTDPFERKYKSKEEFRNYIKGWLPCYASIPAEQYEKFIEKVVDAASCFAAGPDLQEIVIPHECLSMIARKPRA